MAGAKEPSCRGHGGGGEPPGWGGLMSEASWTKPCREPGHPSLGKTCGGGGRGRPLSTSARGTGMQVLAGGTGADRTLLPPRGPLGWTLPLTLRAPGIDPDRRCMGGVKGQGVVVPPWCLQPGQRLVPALPSQEEPEKPSAGSGGMEGPGLWGAEGSGLRQSLGRGKG